MHSLFSPFYPESTAVRQAARNKVGLRNDSPFLIHVGGNQPYKNRAGLLSIFDALRRHKDATRGLKLLMVGSRLPEELHRFIDERGLKDHVIERSGIDNDTLRALYSEAVALIFPSTFEGLGMPILEAQASGCPVFTTNRAPMTEVGRDVARYFDPDEHESAADIIVRGLTDLEDTTDRVQRGLEYIDAHFRPERMVSDYLRLYEKITKEK